jgi:hypothetical protein
LYFQDVLDGIKILETIGWQAKWNALIASRPKECAGALVQAGSKNGFVIMSQLTKCQHMSKIQF